MLNVGQLLYILYQMRPIKFDEDLEVIYTAMFGPMTVSRGSVQKAHRGVDGRAKLNCHKTPNNNSPQIIILHTGKWIPFEPKKGPKFSQ